MGISEGEFKIQPLQIDLLYYFYLAFNEKPKVVPTSILLRT